MGPLHRTFLPTTVAAILFALSSSFAWSEGPDTGGPGWKSLFKPDYSDAQKPDGAWSVADGVLTAKEDQCIWTKDEYSDFLLDLEFKTAPGTNSGVIIYCKDTGTAKELTLHEELQRRIKARGARTGMESMQIPRADIARLP